MKDSTQKTYARILQKIDSLLYEYTINCEIELETLSPEELAGFHRSDEFTHGQLEVIFNYINSTNSLGTFLTRLNAVRSSDYGPKFFAIYEEQLKKIRDTKNFAKKNSKRKLLKILPVDWQEVVLESLIKNRNSHVKAVALLMACGCRPVELSYGVFVKQRYGYFEIKIFSAKTLDSHSRVICSNHPVLEKVFQPDADEDVYANPKKLAQAIFNNSTQLPTRISAYVYRHAFSSNLKREGVSREDIANAMGHSVVSSQRAYGYKLRGTHSYFIKATSSFELKQSKSSPSMGMSM